MNTEISWRQLYLKLLKENLCEDNFSPLRFCYFFYGCSHQEKPQGAWIQTISFRTAENMNMNTAVLADLVVVYDKVLWSKITQMSAAKYFASIPQVCRDHGGDLELFRWEMVLGQTLSPYSISLSRASEAWGAILFANYQTPGVHRLALGNVVNAHIFLEFQLTQEKGSQFSFSALQLYQPQVLYEQRQKTASFWCGLF